jgi:hypothetical protein
MTQVDMSTNSYIKMLDKEEEYLESKLNRNNIKDAKK